MQCVWTYAFSLYIQLQVFNKDIFIRIDLIMTNFIGSLILLKLLIIGFNCFTCMHLYNYLFEEHTQNQHINSPEFIHIASYVATSESCLQCVVMFIDGKNPLLVAMYTYIHHCMIAS